MVVDYKKINGKKLKEARKYKSSLIGRNYTGQMLAEDLGISRSFVGDMETGRTPIPEEIKEQIIKLLNLPSNYFAETDAAFDWYKNTNSVQETHGEYNSSSTLNTINDIQDVKIGSNDIINIPVVGIVRAGQPIFAVDNIEGYYPAPKSFLSSEKEYFYLRVKGDSMNLKFQEGSLLLVEKCSCIENGEIGVVLIDGLEATVKKVVMNNEMVTLIPMSSNPIHMPMMYNIIKDEVKIIGKAKMAINFL